MSRTLDEILEDIKKQFTGTQLEQAANNKGNLYSLIRGMSLACFNQEQIVQQILDGRLAATSSGNQLDLYANEYGITRRPGTSSFGFALFTNSTNLTLPNRLLIQTLDGSITFETQKAINVSTKEVAVPIVSLTKSNLANLPSQTVLYSPTIPSLNIVVGQIRDVNNNVVGSLNGGSSFESDESLRERLITFINNKGLVTLPSIRTIVQNYVSDVFFVEGRPAAGYTTIYINTTDQLTIDLITSKLNEIKALGTLMLIKPIQYQSIDLILDVIINSTNNDSVTIINNNINEAINTYFSNLTVGEGIIINELSSFISSFTGYRNKILKPIIDTQPLINEYLLTPNEVIVNVKSR